MITFGLEFNERKIKKKIFKILRPLIHNPNLGGKLRGNEDEEGILDLEYKHFFEGQDSEDPIYKV
jgi:hypothetical protein